MNVQSIIIPFDEELLPTKNLATAKLSCVYEHGRLRYIRYGETEAIRMIYFAVRDKDWNTAPYAIENELIETNEDGFSISYTALYNLDEIAYRTDVIIKVQDDSISFLAKGEALSSFKRNRIGICVLHPIEECAGKEVQVERPNGTAYKSRFPILIEPRQPFKEIRKMQCLVGDGIKADLIFEGDIFETEDQRNWGDSSYKTYSTSLDIPIPVDVKRGATVVQKLELRLTGENRKKEDQVKKRETKIAFPKIGYGCRNGDELSNKEISLLRQIPFDHYRAELSLFDPGWKEDLRKRSEEAGKLETKLELVLFFDEDFKNQLLSFLGEIKEASSFIVSILVLHRQHAVTPANLMELTYKEIKKSYPHIQVGYGTDGFFADVNRNRPTDNNFDFLSFPLCPQVHAADTRSLLENLEHQQDLYETACSFAGGKKIHISPITFKIRSSSNQEPPDYDSRLHRNFGALWTLYTIKNLAAADRVTFYAVKGYRGLLDDQSSKSEQSSLYRMLKLIKIFNPTWIIEEENHKSLPKKITLENEHGERLEFILISEDHFQC